MKVLKTGKSAGGVDIQIEEWSENYSFMPYGSTLAFYPKSKATHKGQFAPKAGESYRFSFEFPSNEEAEAAFTELESGNSTFTDYLKYWAGKPEYRDCMHVFQTNAVAIAKKFLAEDNVTTKEEFYKFIERDDVTGCDWIKFLIDKGFLF